MSETPQTPPPPPSSGGGGSSGSMNADQMKAAVQSAHPYDLGIIAAGVLAFLFSLFSYYKVSYSAGGFGGVSGSESAWHGFFGWFAALVALAVAVLLALHLMGIRPLDAGLTRLVALGGFAVATLCVLLALFVIPGKVDAAGVNYGHGIGYWLSFIVILAGLALSYLRKDARD